jgi:hypothetical protein
MSEYLRSIKNSFLKSLKTGPRSNEKLKILHGFIATDLKSKLGDGYQIKSLGYKDGRETKIKGRYMDKNVDITVLKDSKSIAGVAVKFVMSNYSQNSNNYFENMLGETANLRANRIPYYQIFILPERLPYYNKKGDITKWEIITENNMNKYVKMSNDNIDAFFHTPNKTLFTLISFGKFSTETPKNVKEYIDYFENNEFDVKYTNTKISFNNQTIYNDYEKFIEKICYSIKSI